MRLAAVSSCAQPDEMGCVPERPSGEIIPRRALLSVLLLALAGLRRTRQHSPPAEYRAPRSRDCSPECAHGGSGGHRGGGS